MHRLHACVFASLFLTLACSQPSAGGASGDTKAEAGKADKADGAEAGEEAKADGAEAGKGSKADDERAQLLSNEVLDLTKILRKSPEEAEKVLGTPKEQAQRERSCVRFVPERTFFKCNHDTRMYDHDKVSSVRVEYHDGFASVVEIIGLPGSGGFSYDAALSLVGLVLPREPKHENPPATNDPDAVIDVWAWGNSSARLVVDGHQFRVRVSVVNGEWFRAKVEVIDNSPLSEDEKSRIMTAKGEGEGADASSEAPGTPAAPSPEAAPAG